MARVAPDVKDSVAVAEGAVDPGAKGDTVAKHMLTMDDVTCWATFVGSAALTLDALCCLTCCTGCGGCCGRFSPFLQTLLMEPRLGERPIAPGHDRCIATCAVQTVAGMLVPSTCCMCGWFCCGTATPCAKCVIQCVLNVEESHAKPVVINTPPGPVEMTRAA